MEPVPNISSQLCSTSKCVQNVSQKQRQKLRPVHPQQFVGAFPFHVADTNIAISAAFVEVSLRHYHPCDTLSLSVSELAFSKFLLSNPDAVRASVVVRIVSFCGIFVIRLSVYGKSSEDCRWLAWFNLRGSWRLGQNGSVGQNEWHPERILLVARKLM